MRRPFLCRIGWHDFSWVTLWAGSTATDPAHRIRCRRCGVDQDPEAPRIPGHPDWSNYGIFR